MLLLARFAPRPHEHRPLFVLYLAVASLLLPLQPNIHDITATVGPLGLGLQLGEEKEGSRWVIKGFRVMPDGKPNPSKVSPMFA